MPIYEFSCLHCGNFDAGYPMRDVPDQVECDCGGQAIRQMTAPHLSKAGSSAFGLIDRAAQSAHSPEVVNSLHPGVRRSPGQSHTSNPLHLKLPRQ